MKIHPGVKPAVWGAVVGAVAFAIVGFSSLGVDWPKIGRPSVRTGSASRIRANS